MASIRDTAARSARRRRGAHVTFDQKTQLRRLAFLVALAVLAAAAVTGLAAEWPGEVVPEP